MPTSVSSTQVRAHAGLVVWAQAGTFPYQKSCSSVFNVGVWLSRVISTQKFRQNINKDIDGIGDGNTVMH